MHLQTFTMRPAHQFGMSPSNSASIHYNRAAASLLSQVLQLPYRDHSDSGTHGVPTGQKPHVLQSAPCSPYPSKDAQDPKEALV